MTETPLALARKAAQVLRDAGIDNALLEAELLLASVLQVKRLDLYLQFERPLTADEIEAYRGLIRRRRRREPVQYILGEVQFRELPLTVDPRVLIPRPETEVLVGEVLRYAWARAGVEPPSRSRGGMAALGEAADAADAREGHRGAAGSHAAILASAVPDEHRLLAACDIGTGSGAIALSLAFEGPFRSVVATDISADALEVAAENARRTGLESRVDLRHGELWAPLGAGERFDVIVSNPPYIALGERDALQPEVREWEPESALFAGEAGFDVIDALIAGAPARLTDGGLLAMEVGYTQAAEVARRMERSGAYDEVAVVRDLAERDRVVLARRPALVQVPSISDHGAHADR